MTRLKGKTGFSVTELLIALIMISIGMTGFTTAIGLIAAELKIGRRDTEVALLAAQQIEVLKSIGHDDVTPGSLTQGDYQFDWDVEGSNPKKVIFVATYSKSDGGLKSDTIISYISP